MLSVRIKRNLSDPFVATSGVPQGSHLGPLLFILFINDVPSGLTFCSILIFADDIKIFSGIKCFYDQICLQRDLDRIYLWACTNKLKLNINECKILSIFRTWSDRLLFNWSSNNEVLEAVDNNKDSGEIHQSNFEFDIHVKTVTAKANKLLGFVKRSTEEIKSYLSQVQLYKSIVRPVLLYGSIIWSPAKVVLTDELENVQHKFFKYAAFKMGKPMNYANYDYSSITQ